MQFMNPMMGFPMAPVDALSQQWVDLSTPHE
ncbi:hypothetical protein CAEBREN_28854 [Caenorhabditis brenneri]|uniref:Uncharacterized protein n=1 Tax=Caenorhabditis brenneri TaxID=135651 RepID=G0MTK6_CAEBE|nr:hypothetical protein CAEBREN_28854 [Caenorhabditis brenneri]